MARFDNEEVQLRTNILIPNVHVSFLMSKELILKN